MQKVFISILNFNGRDNTIDCLKSLEKSSKSGFDLKVVVVDNASVEKLEIPPFPNLNIHLIKNKENLGFSGGHNVGIDYSLKNGADFVVILNNDTVVDQNLILELLNIAVSNPDVGIIAPKIYFAKAFEFHKNRYKKEDLGKVLWFAGGKMDWRNVIASHRGVDEVDKGQYDRTQTTDFASGCCMLIKKEVFDKVGMFDERYFLYYEDNDLSQRAKKTGFSIVYNPKAVLWHKNAGSAGGSGSTLQDYYITRNRMLFGMKFVNLRAKFSLIRESINLFFNGRKWQKKGIIDFYLLRFGKGSYE